MSEEPPPPPLPTTTASPFEGGPTAERIGPYHLVRQIGAGGMGEVWLAEQHVPIRRRVAVKVIKLGMDTKEIVARFETERQALALMDHPAIARVFDAGATAQGRPYFVMEYVPGVPITEHCDRHRLTVPDRLRLFQQVCAGVQHAHHKAVIHRDLKPSNVLVSLQDGQATPKIIDFGVAKATGARLSERTIFTGVGVPIGTPDYMSPEQAEMTGQDIDTRTDVYALGVMLYELLTGTRPLETSTPEGGGFDQIRRRIREDEAPKPSTRVATLAAAGAAAAQRRQTDGSGLRRRLAGDLDWIVMKALEKDRARRYGSPAELAADLERHLTHQPVLASPPGTAYRARKFVRRYRVGVAAAATALLFLLAFASIMAVQAGRIARERDRANREAAAKTEVANFLKDLFQVADPSEARGNSITTREILDKGVQKIDQTLIEQPATRAELLASMGDVYTNLGLYGEAEALLRRALDLQRQTVGGLDANALATLHDLAWVVYLQGRFEAAETLGREAFEKRRAVLGERDLATLESEGRLAGTYARLGRYYEAERMFREVLDAQRELLGEHHPVRLATLTNLGVLYRAQGRSDEATRLDREVLGARMRVLGEDHPLTLTSLNNLAVGYTDEGRYSEARSLLERGIEIAARVWGTDHPSYGTVVHTLGELMLATGDMDEAERHFRHALAIYRRQPSHEHVGLVLYQLAQVSARQAEAATALDFLRQALDAGYQQGGTPQGFAEDPHLTSLRGHPQFEALVEAAGRTERP